MSQMPPGNPPSRGRSAPSRGTKPITIVLLIVAMIALFAAGFGVSRFVATRSTAATSPTPLPCVTVTVTPGATLPKPAKVKVNVYNSTKTNGLARKTAGELKDRGFIIGEVDNDPQGQVVKGVAEIRYGPDGAKNAQLLALYIPGATLVKEDSTSAAVDLAVGPDFGSILSAKQVAGALKSPSPSPSGPGCSSPGGEAPAEEPAESPADVEPAATKKSS